MISTVLFDAYGTLIDLDGIHAECVRKILETSKSQSDPVKFHAYWDGRERINAAAAAIRAPGSKFIDTRGQNTISLRESFEHFGIDGDADSGVELWIELTRRAGLFPDARRCVTDLARRYTVGLLSNSDNYPLIPTLNREGLDFEAVVTSETARCYKPDPAIFRFALKALGSKASETVYVGDTPWTDFPGARRLGIATVWINRKRRPLGKDEPRPDARIVSLDRLPGAVRKLGVR